MLKMLKHFGWVVAAAILACLPASIVTSPSISAPLWYVALAAVAGALGIGLIAVAFGLVVLVARRNHPNGGLKPALLVTVAVGVFTSFAAVYPLLRV
jgi:hypothetical protein